MGKASSPGRSKRERVRIPVPPEEAPWMPDWADFALTYNGYDRHGGFEGASRIAGQVHDDFCRRGTLPEDLNLLRCALFWEQRDPLERTGQSSCR